ncbi:small conductance mechanosensitive channel [Nannocystis exedens]|uniref:Small conductance mechanosensitive channel n=1 Tax=Nannocystis exedens TaxID=54 RepID=A0A1I1ZSX1_9BACT|nr:mechanosensitive ion channel family protein [Nannocystis exedens]PCC75327.1 membrane channel protein [Nannocystis exedens]SFE34844.1 small conductance mechanosensitive channel [Nannocystis exedens]
MIKTVAPMTAATLLNNALIFGAALFLVIATALIVSRQSGRLLRVALRLVRAPDHEALAATLASRASRAIVVVATVVGIALICAGVSLTMYEIDCAPRLWAWAEASLLRDPMATLRLALSVLGVALGAVVVHRFVRVVAHYLIAGLRRNAAFAHHDAQLATLLERLLLTLRWGIALGAAGLCVALAPPPEIVVRALETVTIIALGVLIARTMIVIAHLAVDVVFQFARGREGHRTLRYVGRLEHLAGITKRTLDYFFFVGAATWIFDQINPGGRMSELGLIGIRIIALVYAGRVLIEVFELFVRELLLADPDKRSEAENQQRLTLVPVASSILRYAIYFCMTVMALQELGVDTSPILAGAGLLGLAVGLGAQAFVGDVVSGFFILFEGLFLVGDRVRVGDVVGNVEEIGVRVLKIRDEAGVLHCIPNGEVRSIANHARLYVNALVEFRLPYAADVAGVLAGLKAHLAAFRPRCPDLLEDPEFVVQDLQDTGVLIRCVARVKPGRDDATCELLRAGLLTALVAAGVAPQACHVVVLPNGAAPR